jgi:hypothetical protein
VVTSYEVDTGAGSIRPVQRYVVQAFGGEPGRRIDTHDPAHGTPQVNVEGFGNGTRWRIA